MLITIQRVLERRVRLECHFSTFMSAEFVGGGGKGVAAACVVLDASSPPTTTTTATMATTATAAPPPTFSARLTSMAYTLNGQRDTMTSGHAAVKVQLSEVRLACCLRRRR